MKRGLLLPPSPNWAPAFAGVVIVVRAGPAVLKVTAVLTVLAVKT